MVTSRVCTYIVKLQSVNNLLIFFIFFHLHTHTVCIVQWIFLPLQTLLGVCYDSLDGPKQTQQDNRDLFQFTCVFPSICCFLCVNVSTVCIVHTL